MKKVETMKMLDELHADMKAKITSGELIYENINSTIPRWVGWLLIIIGIALMIFIAIILS